MQNDHEFRFLVTERVRELQREARSSHLTDARLRLVLGLWRAKIRATLRRRLEGAATHDLPMPSCCSVPARCND